MRITAIFLGLCGLALLTAGCSGCPDSKYSNCDVSWDFYAPCDIIQGRNERCCQNDPCGTRPCDNGVVMVTNDCVTVSGGPSEAVVIEEEIIEEAPAEMLPEAVEEAPAGDGK